MTKNVSLASIGSESEERIKRAELAIFGSSKFEIIWGCTKYYTYLSLLNLTFEGRPPSLTSGGITFSKLREVCSPNQTSRGSPTLTWDPSLTSGGSPSQTLGRSLTFFVKYHSHLNTVLTMTLKIDVDILEKNISEKKIKFVFGNLGQKAKS